MTEAIGVFRLGYEKIGFTIDNERTTMSNHFCLLTVKNTAVLYEYFSMLDAHNWDSIRLPFTTALKK